MAFERIKAFIQKIGGKEEEEEYTPRQLIDRRLDSLRRQRQHQLNEIEREQLKKQIMEYQKDFQRKHLWGIKNSLKEKRKQQLMEAIRKRKKVNVMAAQRKILGRDSLLNNRKEEFRKRRNNILDNHSRFI